MTESDPNTLAVHRARLLLAVMETFNSRIIVAAKSRFTQATLQTAVLANLLLPHKAGPINAKLSEIDQRDFESHEYISNSGTLVYITTIFDTFIQDLFELYLFLFPGSVAANIQVPLHDILTAETRHAVIETALREKVREVGFLSFSERFKLLRKRHKIQINLSQDTEAEIELFSSMRNTVVHDQGAVEFAFAGDGTVQVNEKGHSLLPIPVSTNHIKRAMNAYTKAAFEVCLGAAKNLGCQDHPEVADELEAMRVTAYLRDPQ